MRKENDNMGKNWNAKECGVCGNFIYYGGRCGCIDEPIEEPTDEEIGIMIAGINMQRRKAEEHIENKFQELFELEVKGIELSTNTIVEDTTELDEMVYTSSEFHDAIWYASTEILPALEVQVVIDADNKCFVSTGSAGYVEFGMRPPIGMKLPVRCWIHTHPFGSAYFSGTDIRTVSIWREDMIDAIVLGGEGHYGVWSCENPKQLSIYRNFELERVQQWGRTEEE